MNIRERINADEFADPPWPRREDFPPDGIGFMQARKDYQVERRNQEERFRIALFEDAGIKADDPIAKIIYEIAWEDGHSSGFYEVANIFLDITSRLEPALKARGITW